MNEKDKAKKAESCAGSCNGSFCLGSFFVFFHCYGSTLKELIVKEGMAKDQLGGVRKITPNITVVVGR